MRVSGVSQTPILINPLLYNRALQLMQTSYLQLPCLYLLLAVHIAESSVVLPLIFQTVPFVKVRLPCVLSVILLAIFCVQV